MILYLVLLVFILLLLAFIFWTGSHIYSILCGIPFVVSTDERTRSIIKLLNPKPGEKIVDLGSGDGKLLFEIAKSDAKTYGFEINPIAYFISMIRLKRLKLKNVKIERKNFFDENFSKYDAVVVYGITGVMPRLEQKLKRELKPGTRVVSNYFNFPNLKPAKKEDNILLYIK